MKLYSYIVAKDGGFAPNPFFGYCTLACCKPGIRRHAKEGDWIVGLTPRAKGEGNKIVYFMEVDEVLTFDQYWRDSRFRKKRAVVDVKAGRARRSGDNIYEPSENHSDEHYQHPSAHSQGEFGPNEDLEKKRVDLSGNHVLVSTNFVYFGSNALKLPDNLRFLIVGRSYRCNFSENQLRDFLHFAHNITRKKIGVIAKPGLWKEDDGSWKSAACGKR